MFHPSIIELRPGKSYWRCKGTLRGCGKKLRSWRKVEVVKTGVLVKWQKVFDACLVKQMNSIWQETPQGEIAHIIRALHPF